MKKLSFDFIFLLSLVSCYFFVYLHRKKQGIGFCPIRYRNVWQGIPSRRGVHRENWQPVCEPTNLATLLQNSIKKFNLTNKKRKIYGKIWRVSVLFVYLQPEK